MFIFQAPVSVVLPDVLTAAIGAAVLYLVYTLLKEIQERWKLAWLEHTTVIATGVTAVIVFAGNTVIGVILVIQPDLENPIRTLLVLVAMLLGGGTVYQVQRQVTRSVEKSFDRLSERLARLSKR